MKANYLFSVSGKIEYGIRYGIVHISVSMLKVSIKESVSFSSMYRFDRLFIKNILYRRTSLFHSMSFFISRFFFLSFYVLHFRVVFNILKTSLVIWCFVVFCGFLLVIKR